MAKESAAEGKKKSPTTKKASNSPPSTLHPPYFQMISEAISSLKDRTGSSQPAIAKFIEEKYPKQLPPNFKKTLSVQLKKFVKSEKLVKVKNSYKISATEKGKSIAASAKLIPKTNDVKKKNVTAAVSSAPKKAAKKVLEKAVKIKRLSQVKTPEALKKKSMGDSATKSVGKVKKVDKAKSPEAIKKKNKVSEPAKDSKPVKSSRAAPKKPKN